MLLGAPNRQHQPGNFAELAAGTKRRVSGVHLVCPRRRSHLICGVVWARQLARVGVAGDEGLDLVERAADGLVAGPAHRARFLSAAGPTLQPG